MAILRDCDRQPTEEMLAGRRAWVMDAPAVLATAGALTLLASDLLTGIVKRDPNGASRTDTLPTAALLVAAFAAKYNSIKVGAAFEVTIVNDADAAETITLALGTGITSGHLGTQFSAAIAQNANKTLLFRFTNVTAGAEAAVVYAL